MTLSISSLVHQIHSNSLVTILDVVQSGGLSIEQATAVMELLPFAPVNGLYPWPEDTAPEDMLDTLEEQGVDVSCDVRELPGIDALSSAPFQKVILDSLARIEELCNGMQKRIETLDVTNRPKKMRRRRRGELLTLVPTDPEELTQARRNAEMELAPLKASGTKAEYAKCYAKHVNRINVLERKHKVGAFEDDGSEDDGSEQE